jgi:hypothetical protein
MGGDRLRRWWLAILVVSLATAAVFWIAVGRGEEDDDTAIADVAAGNDTTSPVEEYVQFAGTAGERPQASSPADPEYVIEGLRKLAGALGSLGIGGPDLQVDLRAAAEHVVLNPESTATAAVVRSRLVAAATAIDAERQNETALQPLAESLRADRTILEQETAFRQFFLEASHALEGS